jgi:hypothetical protein
MARRSRKTPTVVLATAVVLAISTAGAAAAPVQQPTAREVIDRHIEAVGGRAAIESHSSSHASGTIEIVGQGLFGEIDIWGAAPDKMLVAVDFPDLGVQSRTGYDGEVGWSVDPMTGERLLAGGELQQIVDEADYYGDLHAADKFSEMENLGEVDFDERVAYKLRLVYLSGREVFEYFDIETGRMIGVEGAQESIMGSMNVVTTLGEYQQFGDVMVPTLTVQQFGPLQTVRVTIQEVELDSVDPAVFDLPPAIQTLIR